MRKTDIAQRIHQEAGISEQEAAWLLNWILELIKATLQQGDPVSIAKFGVFTVRTKAPRKGRNPRTGEELMISPRRVGIFRASAQLKAAVNAVLAEQPQGAEGLTAEGEVKPILPVAMKGNHVLHLGDRSETS